MNIMKKVITLGLVGILVLGLGVFSFADDTLDYEKGFKRGGAQGEFRSNQVNRNLGLRFNETEEVKDILSDLTDLTDEEILESEKTLHEIAEGEDVLDEFHEKIIEHKSDELEKLVEEEIISQQKADFMLEKMEQMDGTGYQGKIGQGQRGFRR